MHRADYENLARVMAEAFHACGDNHEMRVFVYENVYTPLVEMLASDNENFDQTRFSFRTAVMEGALAS
jgi:hypothetical protein